MTPKNFELIESVRDLICLQYRNEETTILGKGPYRVSPRFKPVEIPESKWGSLTHQQRMSMLEKLKNAVMDSAKSLVDEPIGQEELRSTLKLAIAPENSGIKTVPMPVLQIMFEKAKYLLQKKDLVVPKPGATDGSYIVAGNANNVYTVTSGKGNSLKCDRACVNTKSNICEHVLAVAEHIGVLSEFLKWFTSSKSGPSFSSIALVTAKQNVGKKGSKRKISNMAKPPVVEVCDIINTSPDEDILPSSNDLSAIKMTKAKNKVAEKILPSLGSHNEKESRQSSQHLLNEFNSFSVQHGNVLMENIVREPALQSTPVFPVGFMHYQSPFFSGLQAAKTPGSFSIKWVAGTTVSSCYGCSLATANPPSLPEHAFCIVHRDLRHYNDPFTGLPKVTPKSVNVHFHPRVSCVRQRYPVFSPTDLIAPPEYFQFLNAEHLPLLRQELGCVLRL